MSEEVSSNFSRSAKFHWGVVTWVGFVTVMSLAAYLMKGFFIGDWSLAVGDSLRELIHNGADFLNHLDVFVLFKDLD